VVIEFINSEADRAILEYQSRVSNTLNSGEPYEAMLRCNALGVPYHKLEGLLCNALAHWELIPLRIEVMRSTRVDNDKARRWLAIIDASMQMTNRNADWTDKLLVIDPERIPDDLLDALAKLRGHYEEDAADERERLLRARLGLPPGRLKRSRSKKPKLARLSKEQAVARYAAIGYVSVELMKLFRDHAPHDDIVAPLLRFLFYVSQDDLPHCRAAYLKLQKFS
jgi:hypothetical protein